MSSDDSKSWSDFNPDKIIYDDPSKAETPGQENKAVALEYDQAENEAPRVSAKGSGEIARKILQLAEQEEIPVYQDKDLVQLLYELDLDEQIPASLYEVVAEIFAFLYKLNEDERTRSQQSEDQQT